MFRKSLCGILLLVMFFSLCSFAGCQYILPAEEEALAPPLVAPAEVIYRTVPVERKDLIYSLNHRASFASNETADMFVDYNNAVIRSVEVSYGQEVSAGDVLVYLNQGDIEWEMQRAEYSYQRAKAVYERNKNRGSEFDRKMTELDYLTAKSEYDQMVERYESSTIIAPIDGLVTYITGLKPGDVIDSYVPIARVSNPDSVELRFDEKKLYNYFSAGMEVTITYKDVDYQGTITSTPLDRPVDADEDIEYSIMVKPEEKLAKIARLGDEVKITTIVARSDNTLVIPSNVLHTYQNRNYVYVLVDDIKEERDVKVGLANSTQVEILEGLEEGELVVTR